MSHPFAKVGSELREISDGFRRYLRPDLLIASFCVLYLAFFAPLTERGTANPRMLAAYSNDEPFLVMALEAMLVEPFGNPGNYFDPQQAASQQLPPHWGSLKYPNITYYGGAMFELALAPYAILRAVGLSAFPTGPIVLRTITLIAGVLSLLVLYNIAKERGSRAAGLLTVMFMASDQNFLYYTSFIHPDALQMCFALFAFVFATEHSKRGSRASLIAFGLFCGFVQGTKLGGPWLIPTGMIAIWFGARATAISRFGLADGAGRARLGKIFGFNALVLGLATLAGFFISTPYAFIDSYYIRSMTIAYQIVSQDHLQLANPTSLISWATSAADYVGPLGITLFAVALLRYAYLTYERPWADPAATLAITVSATQFLWFGITGRLWHVMGYLIFGFGLMALLTFEAAVAVAQRVGASASKRSLLAGFRAERLSAIVLMLVIATAADGRLFTVVHWLVEMKSQKRSTVIAANDWAVNNAVSASAKILFDDLAYFDPVRFPNAQMHGGVLKWVDVDRINPDYILLSSSLYGSDWMKNLIATQRLEPLDTNPFNVRLYQDLLVSDQFGPTKISQIRLVNILRPKIYRRQALSAKLVDGCAKSSLCRQSVRSHLMLVANLEGQLRLLAQTDAEPVNGPEIRIFRVIGTKLEPGMNSSIGN